MGLRREFLQWRSAVNELAEKLGMDPVKIREKNMVREGQVMPAYYGENRRTAVRWTAVWQRAKEMIDWDEKYPCRDMGNGKVRGVGVAMAMQGSGISGVDVGSALCANLDDGRRLYTDHRRRRYGDRMRHDIVPDGRGECLECAVEEISVYAADTDVSPYDSGSYASSTTYVTGRAVAAGL